MKERPILFSGEMVRAILEGRKTQTRMVRKRWVCPYGVPGDRLWVRETWGVGTRPHPVSGWVDGIEYRADEAYLEGSDLLPLNEVNPPDGFEWDSVRSGWRPSIHMPRWASRILLEVTEVRVQRVQEITCGGTMFKSDVVYEGCPESHWSDAEAEIGWFQSAWDSINAKRGYGWESNPRVWAITFRRIEP